MSDATLDPAPDPVADPRAVVTGDGVRFTVLTPRLIRLELAADNRFEDRPTKTFRNRRLPVPDFAVQHVGQCLSITTSDVALNYRSRRRGRPTFNRSTLSVAVTSTGAVWRPGRGGSGRDGGNLGGTQRTLDATSGPVPLEPGLVGRDGWALVDDSKSPALTPDGWVTARERRGSKDLYLFAAGCDYRRALRDFAAVSGPIPLIPRWALGNWWSRYHAYRQSEIEALNAEFTTRRIPLSVFMIDMDWHHTEESGPKGAGWTGYTWNRELIEDPAGLLATLHRTGRRVGLNLHPADGVGPHEDAYPAVATRLGVDPTRRHRIPFDLTDRAFADAYFTELHHPHEAIGVDFWWIDWQQGRATDVDGVDPLWWLNHLHTLDLARPQADRRGLILSRWGGLGSHREPVGFSGDTWCTWEALEFQPFMTATSANVAFGWWSHDIGGHQRGDGNDELFLRWLQFGVFSPIVRLHASSESAQERRPWVRPPHIAEAAISALRFRHRLIPYLYSMAALGSEHVECLCTPMYYRYPNDDEAYRCHGQYWFGTELIAAPFTRPAEPLTGISRQVMWLGPGRWYGFWTGHRVDGPSWIEVRGGLADTPVVARAGAIVVLSRTDRPVNGPGVEVPSAENPTDLEVVVFPEADNVFELYEDDGGNQAPRHGAYAVTTIDSAWSDDSSTLTLTIKAASGDRSVIPDLRCWLVSMRGVGAPTSATVSVDGTTRQVAFEIDEATATVSIDIGLVGAMSNAVVTVQGMADRAPRSSPFTVIDAASANAWYAAGLDPRSTTASLRSSPAWWFYEFEERAAASLRVGARRVRRVLRRTPTPRRD